MKTSQQRRKTGTLLGIGIAVVIACITIGPAVASLINGPEGYVKHPPSGQFISADWGQLAQGSFAQNEKTIIAPAVAAMDGKRVRLSGFSLPLHNATEGNKLYITPKPGNCYFCNPPSPSGVVEVDIIGGKNVPLIGDHLYAYGKFKIASSPNDASLYTLQDAVLREAP